MVSPDLGQDISPIPRSREENQERAFIAASRRKDRSLDARIESANRASMLHKKRTGKAFHITKEIVEKEAMYEEIDERYQEKRIRMLQAQNMQIEEQFHRHLLAAFAARTNGSGSATSSIASRRASIAPRDSVDGGSRKMSLDLTNIRSSFPSSVGSSMASPMASGPDGYAISPATTFEASPQSYMTGMEDPDTSYSNFATSATPAPQIPAYVTQPAPASAWASQMGSWSGLPQQMPTPGQTPTDTHAVHMWQQRMVQQAQMPAEAAANMQMRQFRDRLASAPELSVQQRAAMPGAAPAGSVSGPAGVSHGHVHGHSRGQSQPTNTFHNLNLLTQGTYLAHKPAPSNVNSPKVDVLSAETQSTPDFCPTPNTPLSPTTAAATKEDGENIMVSHEALDPDFNEFSRFALGLGNTSLPLQDREAFGFDDFVALDDFATVSC